MSESEKTLVETMPEDWFNPLARDFRRDRVASGMEKPYFDSLCIYEELIELSEDKELTELVTKGVSKKALHFERKKFNDDAFYVFLLIKRLEIVDWKREYHKYTTTRKHLLKSLECHPKWECLQRHLIKNVLSLPKFKKNEKIYVQEFLSTLVAHMIDFSKRPKPEFLDMEIK